MTLLAVHVRPDLVEVITDSLGYDRTAANITRSTKCLYLPHLQTAVFGNGSEYIGLRYKTWAVAAGDSHADVHELAERSPEILRLIYGDFLAAKPPDARAGTHVFIAGWSNRLDRFASYAFLGGADPPESWEWMALDLFDAAEREGHPGVFWMLQPERHKDFLADAADIPSDPAGWIDVAKQVRAAAIEVPAEDRIIIGGELLLTRLTRDTATQTIIHRFEDSGDEWERLLAGTANPAGAPHKWTGVGRNDPCPCDSGRKYKHCHDPRSAAV